MVHIERVFFFVGIHWDLLRLFVPSGWIPSSSRMSLVVRKKTTTSRSEGKHAVFQHRHPHRKNSHFQEEAYQFFSVLGTTSNCGKSARIKKTRHGRRRVFWWSFRRTKLAIEFSMPALWTSWPHRKELSDVKRGICFPKIYFYWTSSYTNPFSSWIR